MSFYSGISSHRLSNWPTHIYNRSQPRRYPSPGGRVYSAIQSSFSTAIPIPPRNLHLPPFRCRLCLVGYLHRQQHCPIRNIQRCFGAQTSFAFLQLGCYSFNRCRCGPIGILWQRYSPEIRKWPHQIVRTFISIHSFPGSNACVNALCGFD